MVSSAILPKKNTLKSSVQQQQELQRVELQHQELIQEEQLVNNKNEYKIANKLLKAIKKLLLLICQPQWIMMHLCVMSYTHAVHNVRGVVAIKATEAAKNTWINSSG